MVVSYNIKNAVEETGCSRGVQIKAKMSTLSSTHYPGFTEEIWKAGHNNQAKLQEHGRTRLQEEITADGENTPIKGTQKVVLFVPSSLDGRIIGNFIFFWVVFPILIFLNLKKK